MMGDGAAVRRAATLRWLCIGAFVNAMTSSVMQTAQVGLGLTLASSRAQLLSTMSLLVSISSGIQFLVLPLCGVVSDTVGRKPVIVLRALISTIFPMLVVLRPSLVLVGTQRLISNCSWTLYTTSVQASLADVFEGKELAVAIARTTSFEGVSRLVGPVVGGWLAAKSFRACYALSAAFGAMNIVIYGLLLPETLPSSRRRSATTGKRRERRPWAVLSPLGFLKLLRSGRELRLLTVAWTLSEICEGTYELDRHCARTPDPWSHSR